MVDSNNRRVIENIIALAIIGGTLTLFSLYVRKKNREEEENYYKFKDKEGNIIYVPKDPDSYKKTNLEKYYKKIKNKGDESK